MIFLLISFPQWYNWRVWYTLQCLWCQQTDYSLCLINLHKMYIFLSSDMNISLTFSCYWRVCDVVCNIWNVCSLMLSLICIYMLYILLYLSQHFYIYSESFVFLLDSFGKHVSQGHLILVRDKSGTFRFQYEWPPWTEVRSLPGCRMHVSSLLSLMVVVEAAAVVVWNVPATLFFYLFHTF